jgi:hypothetical protein
MMQDRMSKLRAHRKSSDPPKPYANSMPAGVQFMHSSSSGPLGTLAENWDDMSGALRAGPGQDMNSLSSSEAAMKVRTCYDPQNRKNSASEADSKAAPHLNDGQGGPQSPGLDSTKNTPKPALSKQEEDFLRLIRKKEYLAKTLTVKDAVKEQADRWSASSNQKLAEKQRNDLLQSGNYMKCNR